MNRKRVLPLFILLITIVFSSCSGEHKKDEYSTPTMSQVNEFISKNSINALAIKEADNFTVVLFENDAQYGHYVLYKDQKNQLYNQSVKASGGSKDNPVSLGGVASGDIPFVTVIINNEDMLKRAKEIEVTFHDGKVQTEMISGKGTVVLYPGNTNHSPTSCDNLIIYDKDMIKLYEQ